MLFPPMMVDHRLPFGGLPSRTAAACTCRGARPEAKGERISIAIVSQYVARGYQQYLHLEFTKSIIICTCSYLSFTNDCGSRAAFGSPSAPKTSSRPNLE